MRAAHAVAAGSRQTDKGGRVGRTGSDASAVAGGGIDYGEKCVGIEPLPGSGDGDSCDRRFLIERLAGTRLGNRRPAGRGRSRQCLGRRGTATGARPTGLGVSGFAD